MVFLFDIKKSIRNKTSFQKLNEPIRRNWYAFLVFISNKVTDENLVVHGYFWLVCQNRVVYDVLLCKLRGPLGFYQCLCFYSFLSFSISLILFIIIWFVWIFSFTAYENNFFEQWVFIYHLTLERICGYTKVRLSHYI